MFEVDRVIPVPRLRPDPRARHPRASTVDGRHRYAVALAGVLALLLGGVAVAHWLGMGTGSGSAGTGTGLALTLSPGSTTTQLLPGGSADVAVTVTNPNTYAAKISALQLATGQGSGGYAVDSGHSGCGLSVLTFTASSTGWTVPARSGATNGSLAITLPGALAMSSSAASACQGATFSTYLTAVV